MMIKWYKLAGCATVVTVATVASASVATAEEQLPVSGVIVSDPIAKISYDECCPEHTDYLACPPVACPPSPCEPGQTIVPGSGMPTPIVIPEISPEGAVTPYSDPAAEAMPADEMALQPDVQSAPSSNAIADPLAAPVAEPAPMDFGNFSQPSGGVGFASASTVGGAPAPGYIDFAPVRTRFRLRYDNAQGANDPTRGELLYPTPSVAPGFANANGPTAVQAAGDLRLQELSFYFEYAVFERFSVFIDAPIRWVGDVQVVAGGAVETQSGFGDLRTGFKWGLVDNADSHLTTQFLISTPTGDAREALGTGNVSFDIGLLFDHRLSDDVFFFGEIRDWFTLDAPTVQGNIGAVPATIDLNANILRFGGGLGVDLLECGSCRHKPKKITGLFEVVGWTVLDGFSTDINGTNAVTDAQGDTIVNGKYGLRYTDGGHTAYVGYGHNWTSDRWYSDLVRVEYGYNF